MQFNEIALAAALFMSPVQESAVQPFKSGTYHQIIERILPQGAYPVVLPSGRVLSTFKGNPVSHIAEQQVIRALWQDRNAKIAQREYENRKSVDEKKATPAPEAGPIVRLPAEIKAEAGDLVEVTAESGAELVTWDVSPKGLRLVYPKSDAAQKTILIHSKMPGRFALVASIPHGKETRVAICWVTIGPPEPPPPPPSPPDTLPDTLAALYAADPSTTKQADALALASVYRVGSKNTVDAPELKTNGALAGVLAKAANDLVPLPKLESIRKAIQAEVILKHFPLATAELTAASRTVWRVQLLRVAAALESIAK